MKATTKKTTTAIPCRIKVAWGYYSNTYGAPADGYLMNPPTYDSCTGKESKAPKDFDSVDEACKFLTRGGHDYHPDDGRNCEYDGKGNFSAAGQYCTRHGQHSRPVYTVVNAKSGRCSKAVITACDSIAKATA